MAAANCVETRLANAAGLRSQCQSRSRSLRKNAKFANRSTSSLSSLASSSSRRRINTRRHTGTVASTAYHSASSLADRTVDGGATRNASCRSNPTTPKSRWTTWPRFCNRCAPAAATAFTSSPSSASSSSRSNASRIDPWPASQNRSFARTGARTHRIQTHSKRKMTGSATNTQMNASQEFSNNSCELDGFRSWHRSQGFRWHVTWRSWSHVHWPRDVNSPVGALASSQLCSECNRSHRRNGVT
mmetsp:Transcript_4013/g.12526  ORF Transcript_4013/g.12526 Transcript_4013/m.12526 type:complete len:244 (+) Transcript_4013:75-806(+)